jgi:hypothetical protein
VHAEDGVQNTLISGNVIGGNLFGGVIIDGAVTSGTLILDNFIGIAPNGTEMGNDIAGIQINHASRSTVRKRRLEPTGRHQHRLRRSRPQHD